MDYELSNDLSHHGIKGQKWGVRRFQNKDGSLTKAGGKRYNGSDYKPRKNVIKEVGDKVKTYKKKQNLKKARKIAAEKKVAAEQRKKDVEAGRLSAKQMTTEELNARMERLNLEKRYKQLLNETDPPTKAVTEGKSFVKKIWETGVQPAVADATKQVLKDVLVKKASERLGLNDTGDALSKMAKDWQNKANIARDKKNAWKNEYDLNELKRKAKEEADGPARGKNNKRSSDEYDRTNSEFSRDGKRVDDSKYYTKYPNMDKESKPTNSGKLIGDGVERIYPTTDDIIGEGTSRYEKQGSRYYDDNPNIKNERMYRREFYNRASYGQAYLTNRGDYILGLPYKNSSK